MSVKLNMSMLFIIFLTLKLTNVIMWSWWIIFLPLIIPAIIYLILIVFVIHQAIHGETWVKDIICKKDPKLYKKLTKIWKR